LTRLTTLPRLTTQRSPPSRGRWRSPSSATRKRDTSGWRRRATRATATRTIFCSPDSTCTPGRDSRNNMSLQPPRDFRKRDVRSRILLSFSISRTICLKSCGASITPHIDQEGHLKRLFFGVVAAVLAAGPLMVQGKVNPTDPQPTCNMCPGTYLQVSEFEAYTKQAIAENLIDQQVRDIDIGKAHIGIGIVY